MVRKRHDFTSTFSPTRILESLFLRDLKTDFSFFLVRITFYSQILGFITEWCFILGPVVLIRKIFSALKMKM